jgi:hypothetical protein
LGPAPGWGNIAVVRLSGVIAETSGFGPHDHLCWAFDDPGELRSRAVEFLAEGLAQGRRVSYFSGNEPRDYRSDLAVIDGIGDAVRRGAVEVEPLGVHYPTGSVVDPETQVQAYATATRRALADGFTGLRIVADATQLVRSAEQLEAFARYEHLVDRYMVDHKFSALCAYDRRELGDETIAQIACLHPNVNHGATPFRLHVVSHGATEELRLSGELDMVSRLSFPAALRRVDWRAVGGELVIDATGLGFLDHNSMLAITDEGTRRNAPVVLRTSSPMPARLIEILRLRNVRVELPA